MDQIPVTQRQPWEEVKLSGLAGFSGSTDDSVDDTTQETADTRSRTFFKQTRGIRTGGRRSLTTFALRLPGLESH
jgi:hypothetical protein